MPNPKVLEQPETISRAVYNSVNKDRSLFDDIEDQIVMNDKISIAEIKKGRILRDSSEIRVGRKQPQAVFDPFGQGLGGVRFFGGE